jgi:hypothetical protein
MDTYLTNKVSMPRQTGATKVGYEMPTLPPAAELSDHDSLSPNAAHQ